MIDLGTLGGASSEAVALSDAGYVAGNSLRADGAHHAFRWTAAGGMADLGTLGGAFSEAVAVNASGDVAGGAYLPGDAYHAFRWTAADGMEDLGTLGGAQSEARAMNGAGQVVGQSERGDGSWHAFSWTPAGGMVDLGAGTRSDALGVNGAGQVVGWTEQADGSRRAFSWTAAGGRVDLGAGAAIAVNAAGQVAGMTTLPDDSPGIFSWTETAGTVVLSCGRTLYDVLALGDGGHVVASSLGVARVRSILWTAAGGCVDLGTLGGTHTVARAVNPGGQVVGWSSLWDDHPQHAFTWTADGGMVDLGYWGLDGLKGRANAVDSLDRVAGWSELVPLVPRDDFAYGPTHAVLWKTAPTAEIEQLVSTLAGMVLPRGTAISLAAKLAAVLAALDAQDVPDACDALASFADAVAAQTGKKLTPEQAGPLGAAAADVRAMLQCP
ncbi:hypothetical protein PSR1_00375 [Anaeromyxobacter sp. PSR-1]|nr:hypothetical protein PSR1_00375 [Anaeromyxobacter sp. PSR-1]